MERDDKKNKTMHNNRVLCESIATCVRLRAGLHGAVVLPQTARS